MLFYGNGSTCDLPISVYVLPSIERSMRGLLVINFEVVVHSVHGILSLIVLKFISVMLAHEIFVAPISTVPHHCDTWISCQVCCHTGR